MGKGFGASACCKSSRKNRTIAVSKKPSASKANSRRSARSAHHDKKKTRAELERLSLNRPEDRFQTHSAADVSTKELDADLKMMERYLGKPMPAVGKSCVLRLAVRSRDQKATQGRTPTHNWRMGWAEWRNAVFLWVNLEGGNSLNMGSSRNMLSKNGREVTWFVGGANPIEATPVVSRLLQISRGDKRHLPSSTVAKKGKQKPFLSPQEAEAVVLLFVRKHADEPYINCGRLSKRSHNSKVEGFKFIWTLKDFAALNRVSQPFKSLLTSDPPKTPHAKVLRRWA
eukprot:TRINITY_DN62233_c0_g1_i1.p1 TRINITY_DN62233_c0_g1~~TRINITY_DN62233_c0_g1_i1.p1  ORF type:complete len:285 (-),score=35.56 TRINITY_DN62233_c0_g1_i1:179-1033(-)